MDVRESATLYLARSLERSLLLASDGAFYVDIIGTKWNTVDIVSELCVHKVL